jgi:tRNA threonylcarbamoyl adenosine modification protein YeaZ
MKGSGAEPASPRIVLAIDTATGPGSIALRIGEQTSQRTIEWRAAFRETAPAIQSLMAEAGLDWGGLDGIAVPTGPGSFTGLRVGAALALGLSRIADRPLFGVPTLAAVAAAFAPEDARRVCATLDARRGRRYAALYERVGPGRWEILEGPLDAEPSAVEELAGGAPQVGPDPASGQPGPRGGVGLAAAVACLATADPGRYGLASPRGLELVYARSGVDVR